MFLHRTLINNLRWLILLLFCLVANLYAMVDDLRFRNLSIKEGLSQNSGYTVVQDNKGFIWIGTETGLNKYDGHTFTVYEKEIYNPNSLSNSFIICIYIDSSGIFWIGTEEGLNRFNKKKDRFTRFFHDPNDSSSLSHNRILSICEDKAGLLWIGTDNGLNTYDRKKRSFFRYYYDSTRQNSISSNAIRVLYQDREGTMWIGTEGGGLNRFDREKKLFTRYQYNPDDPNSLCDNNVTCIFEDRSGVLWIGTERGGLNQFDREKESFRCLKKITYAPETGLSDNHINVIYEDQLGILWIGTNDGGLSILDRENRTVKSYHHNPNNPRSLSSNRVLCIYEDNSGGLWFGTQGGGVNLYNREIQKFALYRSESNNPNSLSYSDIRPIYEDQSGILWIGTDGGGLNKLNRNTNTFTHFKHDPNYSYSISDNRVFAIIEDKKGNFWVGTHGGGLNKFNLKNGQFIHYKYDKNDPSSISNDKIRDICESQSGDLWIGTNGGGVNKFIVDEEIFIRYTHNPDDSNSLSNDRVFCVFEDHQGILWIGTFGGGLNEYNPEKNTFTRYSLDINNPKSISDNFILSINEDHAKNLWVGTVEGGLNKFDRKTKQFRRYTKKNGLPDNVVYDILEDGNHNLWLSTNRGLTRFNPETRMVKSYDTKDGLQSNEFNTGTGFKSKKGEMFFGGVNGFNAFYPDSIIDNPYIPPVVITDFQIFNKPVPIGKLESGRTILENAITEAKQVVLSHKDKVFSFEFTALHYFAPEKNQYAYMMQGLEDDWNYVGTRRFVNYTAVRPGKYLFKVKGSNEDGVWNEDGTSLWVTIVPPFWATWWFRVITGLVLFFILVSILIYQLNRLKRQRAEDERRRVTETFSRVLEQGDAAVYRRKIDSNEYEYMGDGIKDITGYDVSDFSFSFWKKIVISDEMVGSFKGKTFEEVYKLAEKGKINRWISDLQIKSKSGEIKWIRDMASGIRDERDYSNLCFGILFDITDRKIAEQELARTSEELSLKNQEMEADLNMAREVQMAFIAKHCVQFPENVPPEKSALEFNHRYLPATTLAGDFFHILPISEHKAGVLICDVMGHGARASLLTAYLQGLIEELMPFAEDSALFMKKLNVGLNSIMSQFSMGIFATVFYLVADIKSGNMYFTNAGHPGPIVLKRREGSVERIQSKTKRAEPALGLFEDFSYSITERPMTDDDVLLFFTDGIYEVENREGKMFGKDKFLNSVKNQLKVVPDQMLDGILNEISGYSDTKDFKDDVCLLSMHVKHAVTH